MARPKKSVKGLDPKKPSYEKHPEFKRNTSLPERNKKSRGMATMKRGKK